MPAKGPLGEVTAPLTATAALELAGFGATVSVIPAWTGVTASDWGADVAGLSELPGAGVKVETTE